MKIKNECVKAEVKSLFITAILLFIISIISLVFIIGSIKSDEIITTESFGLLFFIPFILFVCSLLIARKGYSIYSEEYYKERD